LQQTQKEIPFKSEQNQQMIREEVHGANLSILLSLYPKILAIALLAVLWCQVDGGKL
jgi:hypothetical protein